MSILTPQAKFIKLNCDSIHRSIKPKPMRKGTVTFALIVGSLPLMAQTRTFEDSVALLFREVKQATEAHRNLWNYDLYAPIMLVNRNDRAVFANMPDSSGVLKQVKSIFKGTLPKDVNVANTATRWAGRHWAMIMLPLPTNKQARLNLLTHELFHRAQPYLRLRTNNYDNNHLDKKEGRVYLRLELLALQKAVRSGSQNEMNRHLKNALAFRLQRYSIYPGADSTENLLEFNEGLAEFTGAMLSGRNKKEMVQHFTGRIDNFFKNQTFVRSFPYETTPVYGYLLSQRNAGWNQSITVQTNLTNLFTSAFAVQPEPLSEKTHQEYESDIIWLEENSREVKIAGLISLYSRKFITDPHFELPFENMNISFDYTNIMPLHDQGTVYITVRVKDNWGILTVTDGALLDSNWSKITVTAPVDISKGGVKGDGWALELNENYTVQQDVFTKNYYLNKKPKR